MSKVINALTLILISLIFMSTAEPVEKQRIVVIDTGIKHGYLEEYLCKDGHKDVTGTGLADNDGHGTNIAAIISKGMDKKRQCLVIVKWYNISYDAKFPKNITKRGIDAIKAAVAVKPVLINMSLSGNLYIDEERQLIENALASGVIIVVSAGNDGMELQYQCEIYPACYGYKHPNFHVVANYSKSSNTEGPITDVEDGNNIEAGGTIRTGTSQSAAVLSAKLIRNLK